MACSRLFKDLITVFIFIFLLSIFVLFVSNVLDDSYCSIIIFNFILNIVFLILFLICLVTIYKFLSEDNTSRFNIMAFYYSLHITVGIFNARLNLMDNFPLTLGLACLHYSESLSDNFSDIGYSSINDHLGVFFFNFYLSQHLENEPIPFLRNLVCLDSQQLVATFTNKPLMLKECLLEYNRQKMDAIVDSHNTLVTIVNYVIERAKSELDIDLLEKYNHDQWLTVYINNLASNPIVINGTKYIIHHDSQLNISYLVNEIDLLTFEHGLQQMKDASAILDQ